MSKTPQSGHSSHASLRKEPMESATYCPTKHEQEILDRQLLVPPVTASFFMLFRYATPTDLFIIFVSSICAIAAGACVPLMTIVFGSITTSFSSFYTGSPDIPAFRHEVSHLALYLVYIGIATFVATYISTVGYIYTGEHIIQHTREQYLAAVLRQNIAFFDKLGAGETTIRITSDMNTLQAGISQKVALTLTGASTFITALVVGFIKGGKLTLVLFALVLVMVFSIGLIGKTIGKYGKLSGQSAGKGATIAEEVFSSIRNATSLGTQERLAQQYDNQLSSAERFGSRMKSSIGLMIATMIFIMFCDYTLSFWQGSRFLVKGDMNVGNILTVLLAMVIGSAHLGQVAPHVQAFAMAKATAGPIFAVINRPSCEPVINAKIPNAVIGVVELRGVRHIYPSRPEVVVLKSLDLIIPAGKITALVGASGSGKSTIIGLLERFYEPVGGQVLLDGEDIQGLDLKWLRRQMALVSQEPVLFSASVYVNIAHGLIGTEFEHISEEKKRQLVVDAAKVANAHDFISLMPNGYDMNVGERGFLLSGGQKQRIAIARAVVSDPRILLLDEATSALDTKSEGVVQHALEKASKGRTTIVIAHRLSTIKSADNIVVMAEGSIVEQGNHSELITHGGIYLQLIQAQKMTSDLDAEDPDSKTAYSNDPSREVASELAELAKVSAKKSLLDTSLTKKQDNFRYSTWTLIKFIWAFNIAEKWHMICGLLISIICGSGVPIQAIFVGKEISALSLGPAQYDKLRHDVNFWSLMFFILALVLFIAYLGQGVLFGYCSERLIFRARSQAMRTILRQEIAFFDAPENTSGALVSMLTSDVTHLAGMSGVVLGAILCAATTVIFALALSISISWKLGLVVSTSIPVLIVCGFLRHSLLARFDLRAKKAYEASASYACEATSAIRTIASLTREQEVWDHYHSMLKSQTSTSLKSIVRSSSLYAFSQCGMFFASALGFWYGGNLIASGEISIEHFFICFIAIIFGAQSTGAIFSYATDMGKLKQAAETLKALFDRVPEIDCWSTSGTKVSNIGGALEFRGVNFSYPTRLSQPVLKGISLKFEPGQHVALVGASGCGKSTIIALLERFYNYQRGSILLDGQEISELNLQEYRGKIALVSQEPVLYSGTIMENILLGTDEDAKEEAVIQACKDANIYDFILSLPNGLETVVGSKGVMLSGGQKQRVAIARALIRNPKILLLDEATSALDSTSEAAVQQALDLASKGRTTISIAHRLSTIQHADVIYVIDQGQVAEKGNHESLMALKGKYFELVKLQGMKAKE